MLPRTPFFWGASELTIWELIGSVNTSAFVVTNQKDEPITSGLLVIRPESMPSACSMEIPAKLDARSEESRTAFRDDPVSPSERSDAAFSTVLESVWLRQVKPVRSAQGSDLHPPKTHQTLHPRIPTETVAWAA